MWGVGCGVWGVGCGVQVSRLRGKWSTRGRAPKPYCIPYTQHRNACAPDPRRNACAPDPRPQTHCNACAPDPRRKALDLMSTCGGEERRCNKERRRFGAKGELMTCWSKSPCTNSRCAASRTPLLATASSPGAGGAAGADGCSPPAAGAGLVCTWRLGFRV